mmetsp:Transcript_77953/g.188849  ORF Transcript_77953/g.188849 Transcript_77953/m.188849 type:complete len:233 (-) Transcript_77953:419-1117(-)
MCCTWSRAYSDPPAASSVTMHITGSSRATPTKRMSRGCRSACKFATSFWNSAKCSGDSWPSARCRRLIATSSPCSRPRCTVPKPPEPSSSPIWRSASFSHSPDENLKHREEALEGDTLRWLLFGVCAGVIAGDATSTSTHLRCAPRLGGRLSCLAPLTCRTTCTGVAGEEDAGVASKAGGGRPGVPMPTIGGGGEPATAATSCRGVAAAAAGGYAAGEATASGRAGVAVALA